MTEPIDPPEGEVEGPIEPVPGGQPEGEPQPWMPMPGTYGSRNAGRRQSILESFAKVITQDRLDDAVGGVRDDVYNMGTVVQDYGTAIEELGKNRVMPWAVPTVAPLSQSINRRADPTFQLSDLMSPLMRGHSDQEGHNHTHITTSEPYQMQRGMNTKGRIYYAFITPAVTRAYTQLNFMVSEVVDPCRMDIAVYVVDPNRGLTRQVHQADAAATLGFGESVLIVNFPTFVAEQGSYLAIAFLQHGTGNPRSILGLDDTPRPLLGSIFPPKISATNQQTGRTSLPTFIDGNNGSLVDFAGYWFTPYAELSEDVGIDYKMFTENWPDIEGEIGRPWAALTSPGIGSGGGYTSAYGVGTRVSIYDTPLSTDYVRVRTSVHTLWDNNQSSTIAVRATNDMTAGVGLVVSNDDGYRLVEWSGTNIDPQTGTIIQSIARPPQEGDRIEIDYLNGLVTVRINGVVEIDNAAAGGPQGAAGRFVGLRLRRARSGGPLVYSYYPSPWLGPWSARDLPQENDDDGDGGDGEDGED